jgi:hypothetical protein
LKRFFEQQARAVGKREAWTQLCSVLLNTDEFVVRE